MESGTRAAQVDPATKRPSIPIRSSSARGRSEGEGMSRDGFSLNALTPVLPLQPGVCRVCRSWSFTSKVCDKCERWSSHLDGYVPPVLPLALAVEGEDLATDLHRYKGRYGVPNGSGRQLAGLLYALASHEECLRSSRASQGLISLRGYPGRIPATALIRSRPSSTRFRRWRRGCAHCSSWAATRATRGSPAGTGSRRPDTVAGRGFCLSTTHGRPARQPSAPPKR